MAPVDAAILADPDLAGDANQIQLYAELLALAGRDADAWRQSAIIEVAAGCGGGLLYVSKKYRPRKLIGIDVSAVAARRGRRLGIDLRQGEATRLPFEDGYFDCLVCVDALNYFVEEDFVREAIRVLKPSGLLLLADTSSTFAEAERRFRRLAQLGGLAVDALRDASPGARTSIRERGPHVAKAVAWVPNFLRARVAEMLMIEGSERYRQWQDGEYCLAMAALSRPALQA